MNPGRVGDDQVSRRKRGACVPIWFRVPGPPGHLRDAAGSTASAPAARFHSNERAVFRHGVRFAADLECPARIARNDCTDVLNHVTDRIIRRSAHRSFTGPGTEARSRMSFSSIVKADQTRSVLTVYPNRIGTASQPHGSMAATAPGEQRSITGFTADRRASQCYWLNTVSLKSRLGDTSHGLTETNPARSTHSKGAPSE